MKQWKRISCLLLSVLMIAMTACGAAHEEESPLPEKQPSASFGSGGQIEFGGQTFTADADRLMLNLQIRSNEVLDLTPLTWCTNLRQLSVHLTVVPHLYYDKFDDPHIAELEPADLSPLASLTQLERLELNVSKIADLTPLTRLPNLSSLVLWIDGDLDLSPLAQCPSLTNLALGGRGNVDLSPLRNCGLITQLRVDLYDDQWQTPDLSALSGMPSLTTLSTGGSRGLTELTNVPLVNLVDINDSGDILENLPMLGTLLRVEFSDEHLNDITPLLTHPGVTDIVLEVGNQEIQNYTVISSADRSLIYGLITSIPQDQLVRFLGRSGAKITIVVDRNRDAGVMP